MLEVVGELEGPVGVEPTYPEPQSGALTTELRSQREGEFTGLSLVQSVR